MKYRILFLFLILFGILLIYNLGFTLKEGLTNKEIYDLIRNEQDKENIYNLIKDEFNIKEEDLENNSIRISDLIEKHLNNKRRFHRKHNNTFDDMILNDLYAPKSSMVPPICPACPISCPDKEKCPPCPPCGRCPKSTFTCEKVKKKNKKKN